MVHAGEGVEPQQRWAWHLAALCLLGAASLLNARGWLTQDLMPPRDFPGYASSVQYACDMLAQHGRIPDWSTRWFAGSSNLLSPFKEILTCLFAWWLGPVD